MFPKMGKSFTDEDKGKVDRVNYQFAIAGALKRELGGSHRAIKTLIKWTDVSERTAKNWLSGSHGPSGEHLIVLMRCSDEVLSSVLEIAGRTSCIAGISLSELRSALLKMASIVDETMNS